ncbi:MAG: putative nucleotidyltransferase substrate binding domain-containing protein [Rhodospirillaceae bacterium]
MDHPIVTELRRHPPFDGMNDDDMALIAQAAQLERYRRGQPIVVPDGTVASRFYIVRSGLVEGAPLPGIYEAEDLGWDLEAGDCFPVGALISGSAVSSSYTAAEDTECYVLPAEAFRTLLQQSEPFKDFCTRRTAELLDRFRHVLRVRHDHEAAGLTSLHQPLSRVLRRRPVTCGPDTPLSAVLTTMHRESIGAMIVADEACRPLGIFTLHDVLDRVALVQADHEWPISRFMSTPLVTLAPAATAQDAALAMVRHGIRHVLVVEHGMVRGIVSENDLFSLQRLGMRELSSAIGRTDSVDRLIGFGRDVRRLADDMLDQGMAAEQLTQFIASLNDVLSQRIIEIVLGPATENIRYCWLALGSEGRQEQTFATDQDNGIIFIEPPGYTTEQARAELLPHTRRVNQVLDAAGYALCKGNVMAGNPAWCLSFAEWKQRFAAWIDSGTPEALLDAAIFFDFRHLHGEEVLGNQLRDWLHSHVAARPRFLHQMAGNAARTRPPVGLFRDFLVDGRGDERNTVDLKMNGASPFVDAARIYALQSRVSETNTVARLRGAAASLGIPSSEVEAWTRAFLFIQLTRLRHQQTCQREGRSMTNRINPYELNELDRLTLREAFRQGRKLQSRLALDYQL